MPPDRNKSGFHFQFIQETLRAGTLAAVMSHFEEFSLEALDHLGKLAVFSGVKEFPVRVKCATLAWHTLQAALNRDEQPVSTE